MGSNRQQRRAAMKKGKRPGETYADVLTRRKMIKEAVDKSVHDESVALESDIKTQRFIWMSVVAQNIAFGHAGVRTQRYFLALDEVREDLEKDARENDWEYALEKLRQRCEQITGMEVKHIHEDEMREARKENEANGIFFTAESPETLARIGFERAADQGPKWISVGERLPDWRDGKVLVFTKYGFSICERTVNGRWKGQHANWITHWMPMPEGPEEVKHG